MFIVQFCYDLPAIFSLMNRCARALKLFINSVHAFSSNVSHFWHVDVSVSCKSEVKSMEAVSSFPSKRKQNVETHNKTIP